MSTVIAEQIQKWRADAAAGTITLEEMKEAIAAIRKERAQIETAPKPRTRATKTTKQRPADVDSDALLKELGDLGI